MAVREWRGGGASLGGSLEELQQFRNCFPFFCSLNCFPRSTVLSEAASPPTPCRSADRRTALIPPSSIPPRCESLRYTANFSLLSLFRRRTKRQRRPSRSPEKASFSLSPPRTYRVVVTGRSSHAVRLRSTFFLSGSLAAVLFMPAPLLPPDRRRLPKRSRVPTRDDVRS